MRRYISALALAFAVTLGFAASGSTVSAAGIATAAATQAPAKASTVEQVGYKHRYRHGSRVYFSYGSPRYYGYSGYYGKRHYRPYYYKKHHHYKKRHYQRRHYRH